VKVDNQHQYTTSRVHKGTTRKGTKGAETPPLAKSKLRNKIKYRIVLIFLCLSDLKFRNLANLWS